jgi:hypothetical protein
MVRPGETSWFMPAAASTSQLCANGTDNPLAFPKPVDEAVIAAMYWQPPHDEDVIAAHPDVAESLRPLAMALTASPASAWWTTPLNLSTLRYTCMFEGDEHPAAAVERLP